MRAVPVGWSHGALGSVCRITSGATPKTSVPEYWGGDIHWITPNDMSRDRSQTLFEGERSLTEKGYASCSTQRFPAGSVIVSSRAPVGYVAIAGREMCSNQGCKTATPPPYIDSRYLYWFLVNAKSDLEARASGTTFKEISGRRFAETYLAWPERTEQRRIIAILEEHLSSLDDGVNGLASSRQRARGILALAAESEYRVSVPMRTIGEVSQLVTDGDHNPPRRVAEGVPHITAKGIRHGRIDFGGCSYITEDGYLQTSARYAPEPGDVIVTCVGTIGRVAVVPDGLRFSADRNLAAIRPREILSSGYLECLLNSVSMQRAMATASGSTAQPHLYLRDIRSLRLPVPEVSQQQSTAARYRALRSAMARLDDVLERQLIRSEYLRRAILAAAFSGRLTGRSSDTNVIEQLAGQEPA
jgi:type I restriction enzyme, S subunit